jgi:hypothetical protein
VSGDATEGPQWAAFLIQVSRHPSDRDTRRVVFELADEEARDTAGRPAAVVLRAGGDVVVRFVPPDLEVPGLGRGDYVRKAVEVVRARPDW